ncbi:MAG: hypothetical protein KF791_09310 [Verrucomicrobiae bacterium]|nr:hypothetical protein [Verrucomicrobiae bacterium]
MIATTLVQSLALATGVLLVALLTGVLGALAVAGAPGRLRTLLLGLILVSPAVPPFLAANHWLDVTAGWRALASPWVLGAGSGVLAVLCIAGLLWPLVALLVLGAWSRIEPALLEADPWIRGRRLVFGVLLPAARGELVVAGVVVVALALANFTVPVLFQFRVFTEEFWIRFNTRLDAGGAVASTWPLLIIPLLVLAWAGRRRISWPRWAGVLPPDAFRRAAGRWWTGGLGVTLAWTALTLAAPLSRLVTSRRTWTELPGAAMAGKHAAANSLLSALLGATIVVGVAVAWRVAGWRLRGGRLLWIPFLLPGVFTGVVLIALCNRPGLAVVYQSMAIVVLALAIRYAAVGGALVARTHATADPALVDMARVMGAGRWGTLRDAVWPQVSRGCLATWYVVYLLALWDVETVVLIQPPGGETLALRVFNLLHYGHAAQVNALCLLLLGLAVAPWVGWTVLGGAARWIHRSRLGRSWVRIGAGGLSCVALLPAVTGCRPNPGGDPGPGTAPVESVLFSGVAVIGSRGVAPGQFNKPRTLTCDREDRLYVADLTGRIQRFDAEGHYELQWQMPETDLGKPKGMGCDQDGLVLVIEPHYQRVNHFTPEGQLILQWGVKGIEAGRMILPRGIAQDSQGEFFVSEYTVVDRVQRFRIGNSQGAGDAPEPGPCFEVIGSLGPVRQACLTAGWGSAGDAPGRFSRAEGLAIGPRDEVYVADSCNHRIQVFDRDGGFLRCHGRAGSHPGEFSYPYDIRVDPDGRQYVCEFGNSRITVLDARDRVIEVIGGPGAAPGQFANPWSIALDSRGNLYIADSQNHRVQKLHRKPPSAVR